ncbi:DNA polymerase epsilon subunit 2 [Trichinella spiralis]|uniref:DNA polymerase epsilon subunit 2 n=1 Tax=Trichinella spiralis TaxID=6334 RepID=UPI0001EFCE15|nr:DNA polymerase epsilon subunit 2 [Trichinella spiralis]
MSYFRLPIYSAKSVITFNDFNMDLHTSFSADEYCMIAFYCSDGKIRILFRNNKEHWSVQGCAWYEDPKCTPTSMCFTTCSRWLIVATECGNVRLVPTRLILDDRASKLLLPAHGSVLFDQETISLIRIKNSSSNHILATPTSIVCYEASERIPVVVYGNKGRIKCPAFADIVDTCLPQGDIRIHQNDDQFYFIIQEGKDVKLYDVHNPTVLLTEINLKHIPSAYCFADPISFFTHMSKVYCVFNCLCMSDRNGYRYMSQLYESRRFCPGCRTQFLTDIPCKDPPGCFKKLIQLGAYTNCWTFLRYCQVESDDMVKILLEVKQWPVVEPFITILVHVFKVMQVQFPKDLLASAQFVQSVYKLLPKLSIYWLEKLYHSINEAFVKTLLLCCSPSGVSACAGKHKLALAVCRVGARAFALLDSQLYERCRMELAVNDLTCRLDPNRFVKVWPTISSKPAGFIEGTLYAMSTSTKVISSVRLMLNCNGKNHQLLPMVEQPDEMTTPPHILNEHQQLLGRLMVKRVACGRHHLLFMSSVGFVYGRGSNAYGQLGVGQQQLCSKPVLITPCLSVTHPIRRIGCGAYHSVAIDVRGHAYSWGWNAHGQLGLGHVNIVRHPCPMRIKQAWLPLQDVQCGIAHTIVLCKNGHLYGCGSNRYAQLGLHLDLVKQVELVELSFYVQEPQFVLSIASGPFEVFALSNSASGQYIFHWGCSPNMSKPFLRRLIQPPSAECYYENNRFLPFLPRSLPVENLFGGERLVSVACASLYFILRTQSGRLFYWSRDAFLRRLMANDAVNSAPIVMRNPANVPFDWVVCGEEGSFAVDRNGVGWFYPDLLCPGYCCSCSNDINISNINSSDSFAFHYIWQQLQMRRQRGSSLGTAFPLGVIGNWAPVLPSNTIHTDSVNALSRFFNFAQIIRHQGEKEVLELCLEDSGTMSPLKRSGMLLLAGQVAEAFSLLCSQLNRRDEQETQTAVEIILQTFLHWLQHFAGGDEPRAAYFYGVLQLMQLKAASRPGPVARYLHMHRVWLSQVLSQAIDRTNATINWRALRDSLEMNGLLKMKINSHDYIAYGWKATPIEPLPADFTGMLHFGCGHVQFGQLEEVIREKLGNRADHVLRVLGDSLWKDPERALCASCVSSLLDFAATMLPTTKKQLVIRR